MISRTTDHLLDLFALHAPHHCKLPAVVVLDGDDLAQSGRRILGRRDHAHAAFAAIDHLPLRAANGRAIDSGLASVHRWVISDISRHFALASYLHNFNSAFYCAFKKAP